MSYKTTYLLQLDSVIIKLIYCCLDLIYMLLDKVTVNSVFSVTQI